MPVRRKPRRYGRAGMGRRSYRTQGGRRVYKRYKAVPMYARSSDLAGFGIPDKIMCKLRYVQEISLDPSTGVIAYHSFSANGMYDPDITGAMAGHQPYGFDQLMQLYTNYQVTESRIKATPVQPAVTDSIPGYLTVLLTAAATTPGSYSSVEHMLESNLRGKGITVGGGYQMALAGNGTNRWVSSKFNAKKYFGELDDDHEGDTASNPTEQAYYQICYSAINGNNPASCSILVQIDYTAVLTEPKLLAQS